MARLVVEKGNEKGVNLRFDKDEVTYTVGRSNQCDLALTDYLVSRQHFKIEKIKELYTVSDLQSHNGTYLNGVKIEDETVLMRGDVVRCGETVFHFIADDDRNEGAMAGQKVGGYHLITRIGVGGMGEVYKATQITIGRIVALKVLSPELTLDRTFVDRFLKEAKAAAKLNHPNVVGVHEVDCIDGVYFLSMEYVGGGSVQDLVSKGRKLEALRATEIILQAARALEFADKAGIVHCDIKPDNLMLTDSGEVRLADLGIAKSLNEKGKADQSEGVFGSPHFMAPEQARGLSLDHRADLYSLGVTYYRILAGKVPFTGKDAREIMEKQVYDEPEALRKIEPNLPTTVYYIVTRLMRKKPAERYANATALIKDLEKVISEIMAQQNPDGPPGPESPTKQLTPIEDKAPQQKAPPSSSSGRRLLPFKRRPYRPK